MPANARWRGIELQSLPEPVDLSALRVGLADIGKTALGLPAIHPGAALPPNGSPTSIALRHP